MDDDYNVRRIKSIRENAVKFMEMAIEKAIQNHIEKGTFDKYLDDYLKKRGLE